MRCVVGVSTGPPYASIVAKPTSSQAISRMFGAPSGAFGGRYGSQSGSESRMSSAILPLNFFAISGLLVGSGRWGCYLVGTV